VKLDGFEAQTFPLGKNGLSALYLKSIGDRNPFKFVNDMKIYIF
jgi:hypothetical protein